MVKSSDSSNAHVIAVYRDGAFNYPKHSWKLIASTIAIATILNVGSIFWAWKKRHVLRRGGRTSSKPFAADKNRKVSMKRFPAALTTAMRILSYRVRFPFVSMTVLELFLTVGYMVALFCWDFVNTLGLRLSMWQARAGQMGTAQLPIMVALATKNNVIEFFTGVSHEKMSLMHRATSRVVLISIWLHSAGIYWQAAHGVREIWGATWKWMGTVATIAQTLITILGFKCIRQRFYEFFWITHVILVMIFLISSYIHCAGLPPLLKAKHYVWPCFLIWGLDRICRYTRYLILGNFLPPNKSPATIEVISPDAYRITVRRRFPSFFPGSGWRAGQHMFLAFPTIGPLESHPFTIASIAEPVPEDSVKEGEKGGERELMWIVRTRDGFTRRLRDKAQDKDGVLKVPIFMDGPYGAPPDITGFTTCVFIAGGSGIAYTMPRMREIICEVAEGSACAQRVVFIWAIRHYSHIEWISSELTKALASKPKDLNLSVWIYVTSQPAVEHGHSPTSTIKDSLPDSPISPTSPTSELKKAVPTLDKTTTTHGRFPSTYSTGDPESCDEKSLAAHSSSGEWEAQGVEIRFGRPDVHALLEEAVTTSEGAVSVDASGPESLVAAIRQALSSPFAGPMNVLRGCPSVQLNVEDFSM